MCDFSYEVPSGFSWESQRLITLRMLKEGNKQKIYIYQENKNKSHKSQIFRKMTTI